MHYEIVIAQEELRKMASTLLTKRGYTVKPESIIIEKEKGMVVPRIVARAKVFKKKTNSG